MTPTEHELTVAVDAAARANYEIHRRGKAIVSGRAVPAFDDLLPVEQLEQRDAVLGVIREVLEALPDRAEAERQRIGTYVRFDEDDVEALAHHDSCAALIWVVGGHNDCTCGHDELHEQLRGAEPL